MSRFFTFRNSGFMPQSVQTNANTDEFSRTRYILRDAWNGQYLEQAKISNNPKLRQTPFRIVNNSGDLLSRQNYSCGGACQTFQSRPGLKGLKTHFGHIKNGCDGSEIPPASCNVKYVYDSSDYTRFLRERQANKTYVDITFAGNTSHTSQVARKGAFSYF